MDYKERYRKLVKDLKNLKAKSGETLRNEDIASTLGYSRSYFSNLLGTRGEVTPRHIKNLLLHYPELSENTTFSKGTMTGHIPNLESRVEEPVADYNKSNADKYTKLLEDNDRFFKRILETNLAASERIQAAILAHLQAFVQIDAARQSGGDPEKQLDVLREWGKQIAAGLAAQTQKSKTSNVDDIVP